jgi:phosphate starvation-inducible membrane PsiE
MSDRISITLAVTLVFRTWVIWGHDRKIALILLSTVLLMIVPTSLLAYFGWKTVKCTAILLTEGAER